MGLPQEYRMPQNHCRCSGRKVMMHNWNFGVPSFQEKHLEGTPRKWQGSTSPEDGLVVFQTVLLQVPLGGPVWADPLIEDGQFSWRLKRFFFTG
jgi:hypothetical protein